MLGQPAYYWDELLAAARGGDAVAIARLLLETRDYLRLVAGQHALGPLQSKLSESDLVQESLLEVARDLPKFSGEGQHDFLQWAERVLRHNLVDAQRRFLGAERRDVRREVAPQHLRNVAQRDKSPSSIARRIERDHLLEQAIATLPAHYQAVLHLRHEQGLSWEEVAAQLGVSAEASRKLWARAVQKLQQQLVQGESSIA